MDTGPDGAQWGTGDRERPSMNVPEIVDRAFSPIAEAVERFAAHHSFRLDKCVRGNAGWELTRPHDRGGDLFLLLLHDDRMGLGVGSVWQFPSPEMSIVYSHFRPVRPCSLAPDAVLPRSSPS